MSSSSAYGDESLPTSSQYTSAVSPTYLAARPQRCGRAARYVGETADVYWLDVGKDSSPYAEEELIEVKKQFTAAFKDVSLAGFRSHRENLAPEVARLLLPYEPRFVPQSKD